MVCKKKALFRMVILKSLYFLRKRNYGLLSITFEKSLFDNQMIIYNGKNLKNKTVFLCAKKSIFRMVIWKSLYFLRKRNYGLLSIIFEKSIFDNQMHIYNGKTLKNKASFLMCKKSSFQNGNLEKVCIFSGKGATDF